VKLSAKLRACQARLNSTFAGERAAAAGRIRELCQIYGLDPLDYGVEPDPVVEARQAERERRRREQAAMYHDSARIFDRLIVERPDLAQTHRSNAAWCRAQAELALSGRC
jgi:hypothetical protein